jgi:hypothetical protein
VNKLPTAVHDVLDVHDTAFRAATESGLPDGFGEGWIDQPEPSQRSTKVRLWP